MPRHHERRRQSRRFARGDPPGFVQILDDETLLIPDRPGNNHLDSIENIIANPNVGLTFFVPGSEETLRVNGRRASSTTRASSPQTAPRKGLRTKPAAERQRTIAAPGACRLPQSPDEPRRSR